MTKSTLPLRPKSIKICSVEGCTDSFKVTKGLCNKHYLRLKRHGSFEQTRPRIGCSVDDCAGRHFSKSFCQLHYSRQRVHGDPNTILLNVGVGKTFEEKFWSRVKKNANEKGCWEWQGTKDKDGYGNIKRHQKHIRAHRFSWFLTFGEYPNLFLLHSCDNPPCVNPEHLREGEAIENSSDMVTRGRQAKGEKHGNAKLKDDDVRAIRGLLEQGKSLAQIGAKFGVTKTTISGIKTGKSHKLTAISPLQNSDSPEAEKTQQSAPAMLMKKTRFLGQEM